jgi:hypothetical protein
MNVVENVVLDYGENLINYLCGKVHFNFGYHLCFYLVFFRCVLHPRITLRGENLVFGLFTYSKLQKVNRVTCDSFFVLLVKEFFSGLNILFLVQIARNPSMENIPEKIEV